MTHINDRGEEVYLGLFSNRIQDEQATKYINETLGIRIRVDSDNHHIGFVFESEEDYFEYVLKYGDQTETLEVALEDALVAGIIEEYP